MENKKLLDDVVKDRLEKVLEENVSEEEKKLAFKEAMEAMDRSIQLEKLESENQRQEVNKQLDLKKDKKNTVIKYVEIAAVPVGLFMLDFLTKRYYVRTVCNFEKDYTFTTTPGKRIADLFRFKK